MSGLMSSGIPSTKKNNTLVPKTGETLKDQELLRDPNIMPEIPEPTVMPLPDDAATRRKRREALLAQQQRGGRASTILSTGDKIDS